MILIKVEIYSVIKQEFIPFEGLIDTGATICAIAKHNAELLGVQVKDEMIHLWQVRDPLTLNKSLLKIRYNKNVYDLEVVVIDIPKEHCRDILKGEECTRPEYRNPLSERIILGENFLKSLSDSEKRKLGL